MQVSIPRTELLKAMRAGSKAARDGKTPGVCPHRIDGDKPRERLLARAWVRGYATTKGRP